MKAKMEITFLGHSSFKIRQQNLTVVTDPYDESVGFKFPKVNAQIVTLSHDHQDHNQKEKVAGSPFVISAPGEYEIQGVFILGVQSFHDSFEGAKRGKNTCFIYEFDGLRLCHLGDLGEKLSQSQLEEIGTIDILMIPTGGFYTLGPAEAAEVVSQIQPRLVIPMHYKTASHNQEIFGKLADASEFLKEIGQEPQERSKLMVRKEELPDEPEIVVLEPKHGGEKNSSS